jgi:CheY-like chemotaxis protein
LQEWGYETFTADSGEDTLDVAAKEDWRLDMIIADYWLGAGLTGTATTILVEAPREQSLLDQ